MDYKMQIKNTPKGKVIELIPVADKISQIRMEAYVKDLAGRPKSHILEDNHGSGLKKEPSRFDFNGRTIKNNGRK